MFRLPLRPLFAALLAVAVLAPAPAWADVSGPACIIDGSTMAIGGRRAFNRCNGGMLVKLYGVEAPALDQLCKDAEGRAWRCGLAAGSALLRMTKDKTVECKGNATDREGRLVAFCTVDGTDLGREMVLSGMAFADRVQSKQYVEVEDIAKAAARGIWRGGEAGVVRPDVWRRMKGR